MPELRRLEVPRRPQTTKAVDFKLTISTLHRMELGFLIEDTRRRLRRVLSSTEANKTSVSGGYEVS
jgi:hypothetical protein